MTSSTSKILATLCWSPIYKSLEYTIRDDNQLIFAVVPFVKLNALKELHRITLGHLPAKIICRWLPADIIAAVSDLDIFPYLATQGCELYINPEIHLKLYVFNSNTALNTSGNLTMRGLGFSENANIEVGSMVSLEAIDWARIYQIIDTSHRVDEALYTTYRNFLAAQQPKEIPFLPVSLLPPRKRYTIGSLPAVETPQQLSSFYMAQNASHFSTEEVRRGMHDIVLFSIAPNLPAETLEAHLGAAFRATPFVSAFVAHLKSERSLHFGAVNAWIHQQCEDVPLPYRWEIKDNTRIFYNWLAHFFDEITWDRPNYSQVIYWNH